jgi:hypothetical protein
MNTSIIADLGSLGPGVSNTDRDFAVGSGANMANTKEGNQAILEIKIKIAERKIEMAQLARAYMEERGLKQLDMGFYAVADKYAKENPLFEGREAPGPAVRGDPAALKALKEKYKLP